MNNLSKYSNKYKKYAFRKIGKFFGSCAVATVITLSGAAIMAPNVAVYASSTDADGGGNDIHNLPSSSEGYEVIIPKGKIYRRNDKKDNQTPELVDPGYNGRSFIVKSDSSLDNPSELFKKLYDKDGDGEIDDKYKNPEPIDNSRAGENNDDGTIVPYRSEINPKYPHVVDSGLTNDDEGSNNKPGVWEYNPDGKYKESDGVIDESDNIVVARKPFTIDENAEENVVNDDGSVVLNGDYEIHVNEGDHIEAKDDVYEVGTKPKVEETPIPFTTRYEKDNDSPKGKETEVTPGVDGKTVKTTTYEVDPNTGKVTENPSTSETTAPVTRVVKIGAQPKVEETPIPFTTRYEKDNDSPKGKETEVTPGVPGKTVTTTTYEVDPNTGNVTENPSTSVTTDPTTRVVKVGTQPKVEETPIPFTTSYEKDDEAPKGKETEVTPGVPGKTVTTTTYEVDPNTGNVTENPSTSVTTDPTTRVVKVGTQPKVEETPIPFTTSYEKDDEAPKGKETEVTPGVLGKTVTTTTYTVDPNTGKVTENPSTSVTTDPVTRVVKVGTQPKVDETPIPFVTRYEKDDESPKGKETEVTPGVDGKTVTTTTYTVDPNTGKVTENPSTPVTTDSVTRVVKVGTQPKVDETPIPFVTRYEKDDESPKGKETEVTPGVDGKTVTTTTYTVDPNTGKVTENPSTPVTTDSVTRVVKVGTQPKVDETPIPFVTRYEKDDESPKGKETEVTPGVDGKTVTTTTYTVDPNTGKVTENPSTSVTTDPTTRVVKVGTQPKVEKTPIPFETRYEDDNSIPEGEEREVTAGVNGETVKTTTYEINPDTGVVTANEPTTKTTDPVTRVVKRGTKPKVEETLGNPQSEQPGAGTPETPQPEQPGAGTPETPQPEQPRAGTPETPQSEQPGAGTPETPQPEQPGAGTPENPQPEQPGEETTNGDKPTDKPTEGTPSGDKPTEGTPSSPERSTSHSITPSSSSSTSTPEKPSKAETPAVRTVWRDENGKELKVPSGDKQEAGEFEGYEFVESHREGDNVTVHVFRAKKTTTNTPNEKTTQPEEKQVAVATVTSENKVEETLSSPTSEKVELPNTGTVTNGFFTAEVAAILAGLGILIPGVKKKETEE